MALEIRNAKISGTELGHVANGLFSAWISLDFGGSGQSFGGYGMDEPINDANDKFICRQGTAWGLEFIAQVLSTVDVTRWEDLKGVSCRVRGEPFGRIEAIGHYLEDNWFVPKELTLL